MKVRVSGILRYWSYVVLDAAGIRAGLYGGKSALNIYHPGGILGMATPSP